MATPVITATKYHELQRHGYAGPASTLEPETVAGFTGSHTDWLGNHWFMYVDGGRGTVLSPVNVTPDGALEDAPAGASTVSTEGAACA